MEKVFEELLKTLAVNSPKWLQGLGALAVSKGILGIYQAQYKKIKTLVAENEELKAKIKELESEKVKNGNGRD